MGAWGLAVGHCRNLPERTQRRLARKKGGTPTGRPALAT